MRVDPQRYKQPPPAKKGFEEFYNEKYEPLVAWLLKHRSRLGLKDRANAEDVTRWAFAQMHRDWEKFDLRRGAERFTLLCTYARNIAVSEKRRWWRKSNIRQTLWIESPDVERRLPSPRDPAHICEEKARALRVWEAVESLPPVQRDAIELCRIYELPRAVVAAQLGLTLNQLKRAIFQGVHTMKERLGR